jgi:aspartokinase/homoserine dehydrogenase 1
MLVQKYGGSSLANLDSFMAAGSIISNAGSKEKVVVVLSAMYGVTDLLESSITAAVEGGDFRAALDRAI